jgi:hypothetical protein
VSYSGTCRGWAKVDADVEVEVLG